MKPSLEKIKEEMLENNKIYARTMHYLESNNAQTEEEMKEFLLKPQTEQAIDEVLNKLVPFYKGFFQDTIRRTEEQLSSIERTQKNLLKLKGMAQWYQTKNKTFWMRLKNFLSR